MIHCIEIVGTFRKNKKKAIKQVKQQGNLPQGKNVVEILLFLWLVPLQYFRYVYFFLRLFPIRALKNSIFERLVSIFE